MGRYDLRLSEREVNLLLPCDFRALVERWQSERKWLVCKLARLGVILAGGVDKDGAPIRHWQVFPECKDH